MALQPPSPTDRAVSLGQQVRRAVLWRSGSQIVAQAVQWTATFLVIRILPPADYGLFAMTQVVLVLLTMLNGCGLASGLVRQAEVSPRDVRQLFGMLLLLGTALAIAQVVLAPLAASYYRQPEVARLLRVQAVFYLLTPFAVVPQALLGRAMDFRHQARANIVASIASAATALTGAFSGWGVWTLVAAPFALYATRAAVLTVAARSLVRPSFDFRGAGTLARYGGIVAAGQLTWFAQSQADVLVAGRWLSPHALGLYTTALFLTQIFVAKVVPPLNEVAFTAYARIQHDAAALAAGFLQAVRIVMLAALPFYLGLAATAGPLVATVLGPHWAGAAPVVRLLALAMPFMTLQVLLTPACDARGRPGVSVGSGAAGAAILAVGFLVGVHWGPTGLAAAWIVAYPAYLAIGLSRALPVIGVRASEVGAAVAPGARAAIAMALVVAACDRLMPPAGATPRLAALVAVGALTYAGWLLAFAGTAVREVAAVVGTRSRATMPA